MSADAVIRIGGNTIRVTQRGGQGPKGDASGPLADGTVGSAEISDVEAEQQAITAKLKFVQPEMGAPAIIRTLSGKLREQVSILDIIPEAEHEAIFAGASTYDAADDFEAAVAEAETILLPYSGAILIGRTIREATNSGARNLVGRNRLFTKIVASSALAASGDPIFWFGNSNGHSNYRLRFEHFYIDGGDAAGNGAAGAIGLRAHECGTSFVGNLYVKGCRTAIDAIGCIGSSFGGERTEIYSSQKGLWFTDPTGGATPGSTGGDSLTTTESVLTLNDNINHIQNIWLSTVGKPIRIKGGLTQVDHIILQSCGFGASDDLIHLLDANESYDYGGGPTLSHVWCEGGNYRSSVRIENTRQAKIRDSFFSGAGANCEQGIIVKGSSGTIIQGCSFRGSWSRALTESRTGNHAYYVHSDSRNGFYGPNYFTTTTNTPKVLFGISGHNNVIIDNHNNGNTDKGITIGNISIRYSAGASQIMKSPEAVAELGAVNAYITGGTGGIEWLGDFRSTGVVRADTEFRVGTTKVVGARGAAVPDATGGATVDAEARAAINALLARCRAHGLIS